MGLYSGPAYGMSDEQIKAHEEYWRKLYEQKKRKKHKKEQE